MPRVHPCYAVKCNPDEGLLAVLAALGAGFDCASEAEVAQVLALGVAPERVVYAHPCKPPKQIRWAAQHGVNLTTFDTESELAKVRRWSVCGWVGGGGWCGWVGVKGECLWGAVDVCSWRAVVQSGRCRLL